MDPATIAALAGGAVKILSPYLSELAKGALDKAKDVAGSEAVAHAREVFEAVRSQFTGNAAAEEAITDLQKAPEDEDSQAAVRVQVKKQLESDEAFAGKLAGLLKKADSAGAGAVFNTNISGDVEKLVQIGTVQGNVSL
jgi:hypothetical protein